MKICTFCKKENEDGNKFCAFCGNGTFVSPEPEQPRAADAPNPESPPEAGTPATETQPAETAVNEGQGTPAGKDDSFSFEQVVSPMSEEEFFEKGVPYRVKNSITTLSIWIWVWAGLDAILAILNPFYLIDVVLDVILAFFIRKRKKWAAIVGIVYSAISFLLNSGIQIMLASQGAGVSFRFNFGALLAVVLFVSALNAMKQIDAMYQRYLSTGYVPNDNPVEQNMNQRVKKSSRITLIVCISLIAVIFVAAVIGMVLEKKSEEDRYQNLNVGTWENGVYTNEFFELQYTPPSGWTRVSDSELNEWNQEDGFTDLKTDGAWLLDVYEASKGDAEVSLYVVKQKHDDFTAKAVAESWEKDSRDSGELPGYTSEFVSKTIAGKTFEGYRISYQETYEGTTYTAYQETYVYQIGYYTLAIKIWYSEYSSEGIAEKALAGFLPYVNAPVSTAS